MKAFSHATRSLDLTTKHLNISAFGLIEEVRESANRKAVPGLRRFINSRGLAVDLKSLRVRGPDRRARRDGADELPRRAADAVEEEQRRENALLQSASRHGHEPGEAD